MTPDDDLRTRFVHDAKDRLKTIRDVAGDFGLDAAAETAQRSSVELAQSQAHMIKGAAGMLDFDEVKEAASKLEDAAADALRTGSELAGDTLSVALEQLGDVIDALGP